MRPFALFPLVASLASLALSPLISADAGAEAIDRVEAACIRVLNRGYAGISRGQGGAIASCLRAGAVDELLEPSVEACTTADAGGRLARALARLQTDELFRCFNPPGFGVTDAVTVDAAARQSQRDLAHAIFGPDLDAAIFSAFGADRAGVSCQLAISRTTARCAETLIRQFNTCKRGGLRSGAVTSTAELEACLDTDPSGRVARTCTSRLTSDVVRRCVVRNVVLAEAFPGCATNDAGALSACLDAAARCQVCRGLNAADAMAANCDLLDDDSENLSCP